MPVSSRFLLLSLLALGLHAQQQVTVVNGARLFLAEYERIARIIARVTRDPARAEELAVEVFLKWPKHASGIDGSAEGWLYRTAVRIALDELRRQNRRRRYESMSRFIRRVPTPEEIHCASEEQNRVRALLQPSVRAARGCCCFASMA